MIPEQLQVKPTNALSRFFVNVNQHIVRLAEEFPRGVVPIISIEHPEMIEHRAGVVMEATIPVAARYLTKRTHRVAMPEEYEQYREDLAQRTDELKRIELEKKGVTTTVSPVTVGRPRKPAGPTPIDQKQGEI